MTEIAKTLATSTDRARLCKGLLAHRKAIRDLGITIGFQWINGSFCEDIEHTRGRSPGDIDTVTLLRRPSGYESDAAWTSLVTQNMRVFDSATAKHNFRCEAFFIDLNQPAHLIIAQVTYWFGLFTHQKATNLWKGILQVPLQSDDGAADALLNSVPGSLVLVP